MSRYKLSFNVRSSSKNVPLAIRLAERIGNYSYSDDKKTICLRSDELSPDLKKILELVKNIKGTIFEIDGKLVIDMLDVQNVLKCYRKRRCEGVCTAIKDYDFQLEFIGATIKDPYALYNSDRWEIYEHDGVVEFDSVRMLIDKKKFYKYYLEDTFVPRKMCSKYNKDAIREAFAHLPDVIEVELQPDIDEFMMNPLAESSSTLDDTDMTVSLSKESIKELADELTKSIIKVLERRSTK
ncbi:MAG TPA: hypothetical protein PL180_14755 [Spirochaetota bacterium]|nr:hypothetical protein [Spirochaetota bacterium]HRS77122.1 hypothetical protein [Spirochaetota bacterium]HRT75248.1 hypothetical protein [Spirochaetota bacterium]